MKKSVLALLLAVIMSVTLLTVGAFAATDKPNYTATLDVDPEAYEENTAYGEEVSFYIDETIYLNDNKLSWRDYSGSFIINSVKYRIQNSGEYNVLQDSYYTLSGSFLEIKAGGSGSPFEAGKVYDIEIQATYSGTYNEESFSCVANAETTLTMVPEIKSLTISTTTQSIEIDYADTGKNAFYIPVTITNQDNVDVTAVCKLQNSINNGKYNEAPVEYYNGAYVFRLYPLVHDLMNNSTLKLKAVYSKNGTTATSNNEVTISITVKNQAAAAAAMFNGQYYSDFGDAIDAALASNNESETITVLNSDVVANCNFKINKDITLVSETYKEITFFVDVGARARIFDIDDGCTLTIDGFSAYLIGNKATSEESDNSGDGIGIGIDSTLKLENASLTLSSLHSGMVMDGGAKANVEANQSSLIVKNLTGNLTNGGTLSFVNSDISVNNVGSYGFSASNLKISGGSASFNNVGYSALLNQGGDFEIIDGAQVSITECGSALPLESQYSNTTQVIDVSLKATGASFLVDKDSSVELTNNKDKNGADVNSINVGNGTLTVDGSYNGNVTYDTSASCAVKVEGYPVQIVNKGDTTYLPAALSKPGYIFLGWRNGGTTYGAGDPVVVTSDMTFTAVWANMPDVTPSEPDDEPDVTEFPFDDVSVLAWYYDAVKYVYDNDLMNGTDVDQFSPNSPLTRAMVWAVLARMDGKVIEGDDWMAEAQAWAVAEGVSDGTNAAGYVTREQLVTMLYRFAGEPETGSDVSGYPDAGSISDWAADAMAWAVKVGLIEGDEVGALNPTANSTRAHAATFFMRFSKTIL